MGAPVAPDGNIDGDSDGAPVGVKLGEAEGKLDGESDGYVLEMHLVYKLVSLSVIHWENCSDECLADQMASHLVFLLEMWSATY